MLDFTRSFVTWTTHPWQPHPYYRWHGGFVGELGDVYRVRMQVDSTMEILVPSGSPVTHYLGYPCRTEITIATDQFFMLPSGEWRAVFTREHRVPIARGPSEVPEPGGRSRGAGSTRIWIFGRSRIPAPSGCLTATRSTRPPRPAR